MRFEREDEASRRGLFASWAGTLIAIGTPIILVTDNGEQVDEAVTRLARVGIESVAGYLSGGTLAWSDAGLPVARTAQMPVDELKRCIEEGADLQLIDVRRPAEYQNGHAPGMRNAQLAGLENEIGAFDAARPTAVICANGFRSSIAASVLERHGFREIYNVVGGTSAWINAGYPAETEEAVAAPGN